MCLQEEGITELLQAPGKLADKIAGISGTRNLGDNLSDLRAQVRPSSHCCIVVFPFVVIKWNPLVRICLCTLCARICPTLGPRCAPGPHSDTTGSAYSCEILWRGCTSIACSGDLQPM